MSQTIGKIGYKESLTFSDIDENEFATKSMIRNGWMDYNDLATQSTPLAYTNGHLKILNDGLGSYTQKSYKPTYVTELFNVSTNQFSFSELKLGDELMIRLDLLVQTTQPNQEIELHFTFDVGGSPYDLSVEKMQFKTVDWHPIVRAVHFYIGNLGTKNNPCELHFVSDNSANIKVNGFYISTTKII